MSTLSVLEPHFRCSLKTLALVFDGDVGCVFFVLDFPAKCLLVFGPADVLEPLPFLYGCSQPQLLLTESGEVCGRAQAARREQACRHRS